MKSEKRFTLYYERGNEVVIEENGKRLSSKEVVNRLNEQQATINKLQYENELLKDENEQYKALLENKWSEYLKKKEVIDDE